MTRRKLQAADEPGTLPGRTKRLEILVSDLGWRAHVIDPATGAMMELAGAGSVTVGATPAIFLRDAIKAMPRSDRNEIAEVRLTMAEPNCIYLDNRTARALQTSKEQIDDFAAEIVGKPEAAHCAIAFGQSSEREQPRFIHAFIDAEILQAYLAALGELAPRVTYVKPFLLRLIEAYRDGVAETFAIFDLRATASTIMVLNRVSGAICAQGVDFGIADLTRGKASPQAMARLAEAVRSAIDYFAFQRMGGTPQLLMVSGAVERAPQLAKIISEIFGVAAEPQIIEDQTFALTDAASPEAANFLTGAPRDLLVVGRQSFRFEAGAFYLNEDRSANSSSAGSLKGVIEALLSIPRRLNDGTLLAWGASTMPQLLRSRQTASAALLSVLLLVFAGVCVGEFAGSHGLRASAYKDSFQTAATLAGTFAEADGGITAATTSARASHDWALRLMALAEATPAPIHLTSISVTESGDGAKIQISGESAAGGDRNVASITDMIRRLEQDARFGVVQNGFKVSQTQRESDGHDVTVFALEAPDQ